jgi:hypothetical protein
MKIGKLCWQELEEIEENWRKQRWNYQINVNLNKKQKKIKISGYQVSEKMVD